MNGTSRPTVTNAASHCETLESRVFLSTSVLASVTHGTLNIRGGSAANVIVLDQIGLNPGQVRISGGSATAVNSQTDPVILDGVTHGVSIRMGKSADSVTLDDMTLAGNVSVDSGGGANIVTINNVDAALKLVIRNGTTLGTTTVAGTTVGRRLTSAGGQDIALQSVEVRGATDIAAGPGADQVSIDSSTFHGSMNVETQRAGDTVKIGGNGDPVAAANVFDGPVSISMGAGPDLLQLGSATQPGNGPIFAGKVVLNGGGGTDTLRTFNANTYLSSPQFRIQNFESNVPTLDTTAPTVSATDPATNATGVALNRSIAATFSEAMDSSTINSATVMLTAPGALSVPGTVTYVGSTATFRPASSLAANTLYTLTITTGVKDIAGNSLASNFIRTFTTGATADTTPPTVSSTDPSINQVGVSLDKHIAVTFSEALDPLTVTSASISLIGPGSVQVPGTLNITGRTVVFTPTALLAANTAYTLRVGTGVKDLAGNSLASLFVQTFTTGVAPDTTAPTVSSTDPAANATGVVLNKQLAVTFDEAMDPSTITTANVTLTAAGGVPVSGTVNYSGTTLTFVPASNLAANTVYTLTISTGAIDLADNPLASSFVQTFTTGAAADTTAPTVSSTDPLANATGVALNHSFSANFSEAMDPSTINTADVTVTAAGGVPVAGAVNYSGTTMTFTPTNSFAPSTVFTVTISAAATDLAGNPLASAFVQSFTTGATPDTTAPTVSSTDPAANATGVVLNKQLAVTFDEAMDPSTITTANVTLMGPGGVPVSGTVNYSGRTLTFAPTADLAANSAFTLTITTGATDLAGNPLAGSFAQTFTTGAAPDTTAPTVSSTDPLANATGVALNHSFSANFSEAMDPSTINTADVTVTAAGGVPVAGAVNYSGTTMTFTPTNSFAPSTVFTVTISAAATDLAGNPLAGAFVQSFTTGATPDTTAPLVIGTTPANNATGVALNTAISATFSEAMDPIVTGNVNLLGPGSVVVAGTVNYVDRTLLYTPTSPLAPNTAYTLTIATGAIDLAGNPLASQFVSTFTTGAAADTTSPQVTLTDPSDGATGVAINDKFAATFSEPMDPRTINASNVIVTEPGVGAVAGTVNYSGTTMTFTPTNPLTASTQFTVTISTGATDLAGNPLVGPVVQTFTTGLALDTTAPTVLSTSPSDTASNVDLNQTVAATFSKSIDPLTLGANFAVTGPGGTAVSGTVGYDAADQIATFVPSGNLAVNTLYTATITGGANGVKDLAGNSLASDQVWTFSTGTQLAQTPVDLGAAGSFAIIAASTVTGTGPIVINGDVGLEPGTVVGIPPSEINGTIHTNDPAVTAAKSDLMSAYADAVNRSTNSGTLPGNMGGQTFTPGLYTNLGSVLIQGSGPGNIVTLDAQGDPNAVFVFQMATTLTTGTGAQVVLAGGAKASNVFWQVGSSATLNTTTQFQGNILAAVTISVGAGSVINGRLLASATTSGAVTFDGSTITVPSA